MAQQEMHGICPRTAAFGRFQYSRGAMSFSSATGRQGSTPQLQGA
jgi:hypothetical protein